MTIRRGRQFLMTPGPTPVPERVLQAMHRQPVDISGDEFPGLARGCMDDLKQVFRTDSEVFIYAANGHGAWEAAICNIFSPGDRILLPVSGIFSESWGSMAETFGLAVEYLPGDWRHAVDPAAVEARLAEDRDHRIKAVLMVQTDTATAVTSDVPAVRRAIDAAHHPALFMVDAIASIGTIDLRMDDWDIDVVVSASQKALMGPPGLSFTGASAKALAAGRGARLPRRYWDWQARLSAEDYLWFCGTGPEHLIFALREALDMVLEETLEGAFQRHARLAEAVRAGVAHWGADGGLDFNAAVPAERANSVTTILMPEGVDGGELRRLCRQTFNVSLGGGLGRLDGKAVRIGHMGDINEPHILGAMATMEIGFQLLDIPYQKGGVTAAVDSLAAAATPA